MGVQGGLALLLLATVLHAPESAAASQEDHDFVVLRQVEVTEEGATSNALLTLLKAVVQDGANAEDEHHHTGHHGSTAHHEGRVPGQKVTSVGGRKLLMEEEDIPMYDDEGEVIEQSDLDDTLRNAAAAQAAADAFNAAQTSVVATSDQGGFIHLRKLESTGHLSAAEESDMEDAADLDVQAGESGLEWRLARRARNVIQV